MNKNIKSGYVNQWDKMEMLNCQFSTSKKAMEANRPKTMPIQIDSRTVVMIDPGSYSEQRINELKLKYQTK